ncbi:MAG TPA: CpsB/CapC family capsule biosynthesis tyrosine phosphatase [Gaiellaceae bacterium]|nr:CpsB/CapC family capsule biosynthesis tyrosine phosphatase [Gaiellaceae bacterium]
MIDTHCHLLYGLDDGPGSMDDSLALARRLLEDGVSRVLCTPHYSRAFPTRHADAVGRLTALREALAEASVGLRIELGAEIAPSLAVSAPLEELETRAVAGRYLVVEVIPDTPVGFFAAVADRLAPTGLVPIFAHPERCRAVQRHPTLLESVRDRGALVQVVAPSLIRRWGRGVASAAWGLLGAGWVDLIGSDAHGVRRRGVHLREAVELVEKRFGADVVRDLVRRNPARVLGA